MYFFAVSRESFLIALKLQKVTAGNGRLCARKIESLINHGKETNELYF